MLLLLRWSWPLPPVTLYTTAEAVKGTSSSDLAAVRSVRPVQPQRVETHQLIFIYDSCSKQTATVSGLIKDICIVATDNCVFRRSSWSVCGIQAIISSKLKWRPGRMTDNYHQDSVKSTRICFYVHASLSCCSCSGHIFDVAGPSTSRHYRFF